MDIIYTIKVNYIKALQYTQNKKPIIQYPTYFDNGAAFHKGHEQIQYLSGLQPLEIFTF